MNDDKFRGFARVAAKYGEESPGGGLYILDLGRFIDENPLAIVPRTGLGRASVDQSPEPSFSRELRLKIRKSSGRYLPPVRI